MQVGSVFWGVTAAWRGALRATATPLFFLACSLIVLAGEPCRAGAAQASLEWQPPDTNTDGSPLTDLAGYRVYIGTYPGSYGESVDVGNRLGFTVDNLNQATTYYFAVTAYNGSGEQSAFSEEVSKKFPTDPAPAAAAFTVADALSVLRYAVGLAPLTPELLSQYDVAPLGPTGRPAPDGIVDVADAIVLLKNAVGLTSW